MIRTKQLENRWMTDTGVAYNYDKIINLCSSERRKFRIDNAIQEQRIMSTPSRYYDTVDEDAESNGQTDWGQEIDAIDWKKIVDILRRYFTRVNGTCHNTNTNTSPEYITTPCITTTNTPSCSTTTTTPTTTITTTTFEDMPCIMSMTFPPAPATCIHQHTCMQSLRDSSFSPNA